MSIPINIESLLNGRAVESARIEYKSGWNQEAILHSICAFANDIDNWGGGYIVVGVEEEAGRPRLPPRGINPEAADAIQKELLSLCHRIEPEYRPVCEPVIYKGIMLLLIWAPGGYDRPYRVPVFPYNKKSERAYYVRRFSSTVKASVSEEHDLHELNGRIPFDDRVNREASISDLSLAHINEYLDRVGSSLAHDPSRSVENLSKAMRLVSGPQEDARPINAGILMFSPNPEMFFPGARIEVVDIPDETGQGMSEKVFRGPIAQQLEDALSYIKNYVIAEKIYKIPGRAEADRVFNYPYEAVEEALSNAVLHRGYDLYEPITVRIEKDALRILSLPGPDRSISSRDISAKKLVSKRYRNRRIGEFLKELHLIEGRNTGIPTMLRALERNGSKPPDFLTDEDRSYFEAVLYIQDSFLESSSSPVRDGAHRRPRRTRKEIASNVLQLLLSEPMSRTMLAEAMGYKGRSKTLSEVVQKLLDDGQIGAEGSAFSPQAKLRITEEGVKQLQSRASGPSPVLKSTCMKEMRLQAKSTVEDAAKCVGVQSATYEMWERGAWGAGERDFLLSDAAKLADLFGCSIDDFGTKDEEQTAEFEVLPSEEIELMNLYARLGSGERKELLESLKRMLSK